MDTLQQLDSCPTSLLTGRVLALRLFRACYSGGAGHSAWMRADYAHPSWGAAGTSRCRHGARTWPPAYARACACEKPVDARPGLLAGGCTHARELQTKYRIPYDPFVACSPIPEPELAERHEGSWTARVGVSEAANESATNARSGERSFIPTPQNWRLAVGVGDGDARFPHDHFLSFRGRRRRP
jgi:hypothetical protein